MSDVLEIYLYIIFFINFFLGFFYLLIYLKLKLKKIELSKDILREVTFVIPAYNAQNTIEKTVSSINNSKYPKKLINIIIVNDGSKDNTKKICEKLAKKYGNVILINKKNTGKADSVNVGLKLAKTDLVGVLDSDTIIQDDLLKKSSLRFSDKDTYAVITRFIPLNRKNFIERMQAVEYTFTAFFRKLGDHIRSLPVAPGFALFRKKFFSKHGYFDKDNITEDFEVGLRMQKNHYNIGFIEDSHALTGVPSTLYSLYRQRLRWYYGGLYNYRKYKELFFNRHYGDLSMFIIPSGFAIILISAFSLILTGYNLINFLIDKTRLVLNGWIPNFQFNIYNDLILLTDLKFLLGIISLMLGLLMYLLVKNEIDPKLSLIDYLLMVFIFVPLQAVFYLASLVYFLTGKKPHW